MSDSERSMLELIAEILVDIVLKDSS